MINCLIKDLEGDVAYISNDKKRWWQVESITWEHGQGCPPVHPLYPATTEKYEIILPEEYLT